MHTGHGILINREKIRILANTGFVISFLLGQKVLKGLRIVIVAVIIAFLPKNGNVVTAY
jgi:hypothetical protein